MKKQEENKRQHHDIVQLQRTHWFLRYKFICNSFVILVCSVACVYCLVSMLSLLYFSMLFLVFIFFYFFYSSRLFLLFMTILFGIQFNFFSRSLSQCSLLLFVFRQFVHLLVFMVRSEKVIILLYHILWKLECCFL